jgi:hypothetical protein
MFFMDGEENGAEATKYGVRRGKYRMWNTKMNNQNWYTPYLFFIFTCAYSTKYFFRYTLHSVLFPLSPNP